jgi:hypothetical protein
LVVALLIKYAPPVNPVSPVDTVTVVTVPSKYPCPAAVKTSVLATPVAVIPFCTDTIVVLVGIFISDSIMPAAAGTIPEYLTTVEPEVRAELDKLFTVEIPSTMLLEELVQLA